MPAPRYTICSNDRIVDATTGLVSHINVLDRLIVHAVGSNASANSVLYHCPVPQLFFSSVWSRAANESIEDEFEFAIEIEWPNGDKRDMATGSFRFQTVFHRLEAIIRLGDKIPAGSGFLALRCRTRKVGDAEWVTQEFLIDVDIHMSTEANVDATTTPNT